MAPCSEPLFSSRRPSSAGPIALVTHLAVEPEPFAPDAAAVAAAGLLLFAVVAAAGLLLSRGRWALRLSLVSLRSSSCLGCSSTSGRGQSHPLLWDSRAGGLDRPLASRLDRAGRLRRAGTSSHVPPTRIARSRSRCRSRLSFGPWLAARSSGWPGPGRSLGLLAGRDVGPLAPTPRPGAGRHRGDRDLSGSRGRVPSGARHRTRRRGVDPGGSPCDLPAPRPRLWPSVGSPEPAKPERTSLKPADVLFTAAVLAAGTGTGAVVGDTTGAIIGGGLGGLIGVAVARFKVRIAVAVPVVIGAMAGGLLGKSIVHTLCLPETCRAAETTAAVLTSAGSLVGVGLVVALVTKSFDEFREDRTEHRKSE